MKIQIDIPEEKIIKALEERGFKIENHDFGFFRTENHNSPVWVEDVQKGVYINQWYKIERLFYALFSNKINDQIINLISKSNEVN